GGGVWGVGGGAGMRGDEWAGEGGVVGGAGRGLGRAFAIALAQAGMAVALVDRRENELNETLQMLESSGGKGTAIAADISDAGQVQTWTKAVEQKFGPLDLLVNNAAVAGP